MNEVSLKSKLAWQCRRGMLELDVILIPFLEKHFEQLQDSQQAVFAKLLEEADPDLYSWIMGYSECPDSDFAEIILLVKDKMKIAG